MNRSIIRALGPSEPDPDGEPKRYENTAGYVRLRWKVGPHQYVERYERDENGALTRTHEPVQRLDAEQVVRRYEAGETSTTIARDLGCTDSAISRILARRGVPTRGSSRPIPVDDVDRLVALYTSGEGQHAVARTMGISVERVRRILKGKGVKLRPRGTTGKPRAYSYEAEFQRQRPLVFARSDELCEVGVIGLCTRRATEVHHRLIRAQGGSNEVDNLLAVCGRCHRHIHANPALSYTNGWLLRRAA